MKNPVIWAIVVLFAALSAAKPLLAGTPYFAVVPLVSILAPVIFILLHAPNQIGWKSLAAFFVLTCVISWIYESLSIATGFPFGHYHYTDTLGPKLGTVPLLIMPAYFGTAYISWHIARLVTDAHASGMTYRWPVVIAASFIMVMWDLSMDPSRATITQAWIWHDGGAYFGVPLVNFAGWFLCVLTIFAAFALWLSMRGKDHIKSPDRQEQAQALALYGGLFIEFLVYPIFAPKGSIADATGQIWSLRDIYESLGLVSVFTMGFVIFLGVVALQRRETRVQG